MKYLIIIYFLSTLKSVYNLILMTFYKNFFLNLNRLLFKYIFFITIIIIINIMLTKLFIYKKLFLLFFIKIGFIYLFLLFFFLISI